MQPLPIMAFLILFPLALALASLVVRPLSVRRAVAAPANAVIAGGSVLLLISAGSDHLFFTVENAFLEHLITDGEVGMGLLVAWLNDLLPLDEWGFILTDPAMGTGISGIFAAGDIRSKWERQISTAVGDGTVAAIAVERYLEGLKQG